MKVIKKINVDVDYIVHIADVHIRNVKRHEEYEQVFSRLYEKIQVLINDHKNVAIYLGGDIVHAKLDMSPELISVTYKFLKSCADLAPTFLILGNHDCNLNNKSRLDALSPIVDSLNHKNLYFLKETGIYRTKNIDFVVWSILDDIKNYKIPPKNKNKQILFYHGAINNAVTEQGIQIKNDKLTIDNISAFDFVLLGDIHKYQYLNEQKTIAYCGSTVQQNFGESISHGFVFWNLKTGFSKFINVENDHGFYTLEVKNGKWVSESFPDNFCIHPTIRIKSYNTQNSDITKLITTLKTSIKVEDIKIQKINTKSDIVVNKTIKAGDIRDMEYQNKLIISFLEKNHVLNDEIKNEIYNINRELNTNIDVSRTIKNIAWSPVKFEFSNMFSYGEDNEINFNNMNGIYGLFANNAAGKSSILDALTFCMFDKCSRTFKASEVLNNKKDQFFSKFIFEIHGKQYTIERIGIKDKKNHVKVNVNFYTHDPDGTQVLLNGEDRDETNRIIREYVGNYDEFVLTTMSLQNNNSNFVDKAQRERKDLLSQFLDLNVFEELTTSASAEANQLKALIKDYTKQDFATQIADSIEKKVIAVNQEKTFSEKKYEISSLIENINDEILAKTTSIKNIDDKITDLNLDDINADEEKIQFKLKSIFDKKAQLNKIKLHLGEKYEELDLELKTQNQDILLNNKLKKEKLDNEINVLAGNLEKISIMQDHLESKIEKLNQHEYDPNCKYCISNQFVQDAKKAKNELDSILIQKNEINHNLKKTKIELDKYNNADIDYEIFLSLKENTNSLKSQLIETDNKLKEIYLIEERLKSDLVSIKNNKEKYLQNQEAIQLNIDTKNKINELTIKKGALLKELSEIESLLINASSQIKVYDTVIKAAKENIQKLEILEKKYRSYELYIKATNRNGVPYDLISEILPQIENEANEILSYLVDFKILLDTDGKSINIYIMYDDTKIWALELASGMEKFISSIAIRNALINYSNLPRPNFIAIDEGFGVLDGENLAALYNIFQYLKTQYKFILIISHIDSLKDMADYQIEISKIKDFSKVFF